MIEPNTYRGAQFIMTVLIKNLIIYLSIILCYSPGKIGADDMSLPEKTTKTLLVIGRDGILLFDSANGSISAPSIYFPRGTVYGDAVLGIDKSGNQSLYCTATRKLFRVYVKDSMLAIEAMCSDNETISGVVFDTRCSAPATLIDSRQRGSSEKQRLGFMAFVNEKRLSSNITDCVFVHSSRLQYSQIPNAHFLPEKMESLFPKKKMDIQMRPRKNEWMLIGQSSRFSTYTRPPEHPDEEVGYWLNTLLVYDKESKLSKLIDDDKHLHTAHTYSSFVFIERSVDVYHKDTNLFDPTIYPGKGLIIFPGLDTSTECNYGKGMKHIGATEDTAYFSKGTDVYKLSVSPSGCGVPEKVITLSFEPKRLFAFDPE